MKYAIVLAVVSMLTSNLDSQSGMQEPVSFLPGTISTHGSYTGLAFMPDGNTVYFAREDVAAHRSVILKSVLEGGEWSEPRSAEFSSEYSEGGPFITHDGSRILYWSLRPQGEGHTPAPAANLWVAQRTTTCFGSPVFLGGQLGMPIGNATASDSGTLYVLTILDDGYGGGDIYRTTLNNGKYSSLENLGAPINTEYTERDPYIARDESYLIFTSDRPGGFGAKDLYLSWNMDGEWSVPRNLGDDVNSPDNEYNPSLSHDGKYFYFSSHRHGSMRVYRMNWEPLLASLKQ